MVYTKKLIYKFRFNCILCHLALENGRAINCEKYKNRISNFMKTIDLEDQCEYAFNKYFVTNLTKKIDYVLKKLKKI